MTAAAVLSFLVAHIGPIVATGALIYASMRPTGPAVAPTAGPTVTVPAPSAAPTFQSAFLQALDVAWQVYQAQHAQGLATSMLPAPVSHPVLAPTKPAMQQQVEALAK